MKIRSSERIFMTDEERRYVPNLFAVHEKGTFGKAVRFDLTALRMVRCRHSSSAPACALGHLPPGGRYCPLHSETIISGSNNEIRPERPFAAGCSANGGSESETAPPGPAAAVFNPPAPSRSGLPPYPAEPGLPPGRRTAGSSRWPPWGGNRRPPVPPRRFSHRTPRRCRQW